MNAETLEAIKKRNAEKKARADETWDDGSDPEAYADIDNLIAEVERLRSLPMPGRTPMGTVAMIEEALRPKTVASATIPPGTIMVGDKIKFNSGGNEA